jgi:hypothetical protein
MIQIRQKLCFLAQASTGSVITSLQIAQRTVSLSLFNRPLEAGGTDGAAHMKFSPVKHFILIVVYQQSVSFLVIN